MPDEPLKRESLRRLLGVALEEFSQPEQQRHIRSYLRELDYLMDTTTESAADAAPGAARAAATSKSTGEDVVTLLCKLEDYLESVLAARLAQGLGG